MTKSEVKSFAGDPQRDCAVDASRAMRQRMLSAMRKLEAALAVASFSREDWWRNRVADSLATLQESMTAQSADLSGERGLLAGLVLEEPRIEPRIRRLREQYEELMQQVSSLQRKYSTQGPTAAAGVFDVRQELSQMLHALRRFQFEETDLIYEATQVDIGPQD